MSEQIYKEVYETASYVNDSNIPEISGYGEDVTFCVEMENNNPATAVVFIAGKRFLPQQIALFNAKVKQFIEDNTKES